ncbi:MAG: substrate binding domain-containing protein, partial [Gammaproteobacteria bacterium]|nr:substrate binding domain-containing protein [Gammaproteobacteria bacterium]
LEWIAEFLAAHPALNLEFVLEDERTDLIGSGIDVALRAGPVPGATHTVLQTLVQQDSRLFASPDYLARRGTPRRVADLAAHDCLIASRRGDRQIWTLEGPNGAEEVGVQGRFAANNAQVLRQAAVAGLGIALLPVLLTAADRVEGRLREVLPRHGRGGTDLRVVVPIGPLVPPAVRVFVAFVEEKLGAALDAIG